LGAIFQVGTNQGGTTMTEVVHLDTRWGKVSTCKKCESEVIWKECYNCEDGYSHHDCGEDTCCCRDPRPNVSCDICNGEGGWWVCLNCIQKLDNKTEES